MVIALLWAVFEWNGLVLSHRSGNPDCMEQPERFAWDMFVVCAIKPLKDFSETKKRVHTRHPVIKCHLSVMERSVSRQNTIRNDRNALVRVTLALKPSTNATA